MESKVLICPRTYEAWVKMHIDDQGKKRVEILAPRLIQRFTKWGLEIPDHRLTEEMEKNEIYFLKLDDLEKDPDFFTTIFLETVCRTQLLKDRFYWKDASNYINAADESQRIDERIARSIALSKKGWARILGIKEPLDTGDKREVLEVPTEQIERLSIQEGKDPGISKKVSKTPTRVERLLRIDTVATKLINERNKAKVSLQTSSIPMSGSKA
ncbi:hypothetical protein [Rhabdochlamydiaceae symbiont of Dictyostelium giganteum]|uniref:hypothetical protein n=1 Tax=Rhabdochlamydiaceae symbiont of Dictyostelium giganteum TaxID=3342349 RepID=UPI00384CC7BF